ncbi:DUF4255 domain-containing protein [Dyella tabacisoli]|uniref:DUF4255 domain-containing protein n=1 Tax=Dyella tabacisoli TaxID=2282381 RepID=A0A369UMY0_9GAMM|nr:DUF4255 domain-containing protein [Dyella tabacisoli]RDD82124.1 DUF4255 domain-containing protein [Dyella tabacisoli]
MSTDLAIAGVTATLRYLLQQGIVDHVKLGAQGPVTVTAKAPDLIHTDKAELPDQLNIFMYHLSPNPGWRNANLPSRDNAGQRINNAMLALDLYYLVTAYSQQELYADVLLGYAMQYLHEVPILTQQSIKNALSPPPAEVSFINPDDLLQQIEQVKIVPYVMDTEEMSKLWMAFQTTYRPSAVYHISVVLIENPQPAQAALPVLTIGKVDPIWKQPVGVTVNADMLPPLPTLTAATPPAKQSAVRLNEVLTLSGYHLADGPATVSFTNAITAEQVSLAAATATPTSLTVQLPTPMAAPDALRAGIYNVEAIVGTGLDQRLTNLVPLALAPLIQTMVSAGPVTAKVLTLTCAPKVWQGQRVSALIGSQEVFPAAWAGPSTNTLKFTFDATPFVAGAKPWIRLRVDGVDSILVNNAVDPPQFDPTQLVPP